MPISLLPRIWVVQIEQVALVAVEDLVTAYEMELVQQEGAHVAPAVDTLVPEDT
jgi:hypothetical protein